MDGFNVSELFLKYRYPLLTLIIGLIVIGVGVFIFKSDGLKSNVEVLGETETKTLTDITVEISGEVKNPGVYKMQGSGRIDDLINTAGGLTDSFDKEWAAKYLNRAAFLMDGQKVFIPSSNNQSNTPSAKSSGGDQTISTQISSDSIDKININTASLEELTSLTGIGQKYGQSIIEHRPYSTTEELVFKKVIGQNLFEKLKDKISVY
jgi:competence protein ComEA